MTKKFVKCNFPNVFKSLSSLCPTEMEVVLKAKKEFDVDDDHLKREQKKNQVKNLAKSMLKKNGYKVLKIKVKDYY